MAALCSLKRSTVPNLPSQSSGTKMGSCRVAALCKQLIQTIDVHHCKS
jgi:hypothetical protein